MVIDLAILLVQDILEMNGGTEAHPERSEFTYSPKVEIEDGGAIISVRIVDTVTDRWRWHMGKIS